MLIFKIILYRTTILNVQKDSFKLSRGLKCCCRFENGHLEEVQKENNSCDSNNYKNIHSILFKKNYKGSIH